MLISNITSAMEKELFIKDFISSGLVWNSNKLFVIEKVSGVLEDLHISKQIQEEDLDKYLRFMFDDGKINWGRIMVALSLVKIAHDNGLNDGAVIISDFFAFQGIDDWVIEKGGGWEYIYGTPV